MRQPTHESVTHYQHRTTRTRMRATAEYKGSTLSYVMWTNDPELIFGVS